MKHTYIIFLVSLICLISCGDDGNDTVSSSEIIGKWQLVNSTEKDTEPCLFTGYTEFKSDGKYVDKTGCNSGNGDGKWALKGNELTITANILPIPITATIKSLTETDLILELEGIDWEYNGEDIRTIKYTDTYKRME